MLYIYIYIYIYRGLTAKSLQLHFSYFCETANAINLLHPRKPVCLEIYTEFLSKYIFYMCNKLVSIELGEQKTSTKLGLKVSFSSLWRYPLVAVSLRYVVFRFNNAQE